MAYTLLVVLIVLVAILMIFIVLIQESNTCVDSLRSS